MNFWVSFSLLRPQPQGNLKKGQSFLVKPMGQPRGGVGRDRLSWGKLQDVLGECPEGPGAETT